MAAETHARRPDETGASRQAEEVVDRPVRVGVVRLEGLLDLVLVAAVGVRGVVLEGLGTHKVVVGGRGGDDVAVACDLAGESGDGAGYL